MNELKCCPIEAAFERMGRKWAINIIRDVHMGKKRFKEFLATNPELSTKMLSQRLKELEKDGLIEKKIMSKTPIKVEYWLTEKGKALEKVLYELALFSMKHYPREVFKSFSNLSEREMSAYVRKKLMIG